MSIYKKVNSTDLSVSENITHYSQSLSSSDFIATGGGTLRGNYWYWSGNPTLINELSTSWDGLHNSLLLNFYLSGSELAESESKFNNPYYQTDYANYDNPRYTHKFHNNGLSRVHSIPQKYYGESIKPGSFSMTDSSTAYDLNIVDDGYGNLYSTNALLSSSAGHLSSSDNYVGNIFYRSGLAVINDTSSFSGSFNYVANLGQNFQMNFLSTKTIYTSEYTVQINPSDFNITNNPTVAEFDTGSGVYTGYLKGSFQQTFSGSNGIQPTHWAPYFNTIGFYDKDDALVMVARYPQPIKVRDNVRLTCKIKLDW